MLKKSLFSAALLLSFSGSSFAAGFDKAFAGADALFAVRDQGTDGGLANTLAAKAAYQAIVNGGAKDADLVRAVDGLFRSLYFQGEVLTGKATDAEKLARKNIFNECWKVAVENINPAKLGTATPEYYYYRSSCMAHAAEVAPTLEKLANLLPLLKTFEDGLKVDQSDVFEGGGAHAA